MGCRKFLVLTSAGLLIAYIEVSFNLYLSARLKVTKGVTVELGPLRISAQYTPYILYTLSQLVTISKETCFAYFGIYKSKVNFFLESSLSLSVCDIHIWHLGLFLCINTNHASVCWIKNLIDFSMDYEPSFGYTLRVKDIEARLGKDRLRWIPYASSSLSESRFRIISSIILKWRRKISVSLHVSWSLP